MSVQSYRDLKVWQKGRDIAAQVYTLTAGFPKSETYGLVAQMRRAAVSIPSNIAEGHTRESTKEYLHHVSFARASMAELETQSLLSVQLGFASKEQVERLFCTCEETGKMLRAIRASLRQRLEA